MKSSRLAGSFPTIVPILPLREMVVFPNVMIPLFLKGSRVVKLAESVVGGDNFVGLFYQKTRNRLNLLRDEISVIGTLARIQQVVPLETGGVKAIADGICRVRLLRQTQSEPYLTGEVTLVEEESEPQELTDTLVRSIAALFKVAVTVGRPMSDHTVSLIERADDPGRLADLIAVYLPLKAEVKQTLLEIEDPLFRLKKAFIYLNADVQALHPKLQAQNDSLQQSPMSRRQRDVDLRHQMRSIQKDLNSQEDPHASELSEFQEKIRTCGMPPDAVEVATRELQRLERIPPHSPEYTVARTYLEVLTF